MTSTSLKRYLLLFWSLWFSVVLSTNVCDALQELGLLGEPWRFASGNFRFLSETTARYHVPGAVNAVLFLGVLLWEGSATFFFWRTWWETRDRLVKKARFLYPAFSVSLLLWAAFLLADEMLIAYAVAATHLRLFTAQLATLLAIVLLPEGELPPAS